ncbi:hypothetical protein M2152_000124 [Microbacteriaceae bacterium SG_E_30_P1]|uniref:DUF4178 domain-containing protein n=1 Tax=Antiquaquibacter oligotrophicus TaxID=2880260 RepID=A0ABT6KLC9_9MICO|nr:hypothetical protein [Antiquaquibacter oligotrophicus]MDH6179942.1 hypothetical protein [Antiquaquibacter oligotrophicus]UDF14299.1 hypothetical protein LH407_05405 [Antiquaquibacter oligotrophicus]
MILSILAKVAAGVFIGGVVGSIVTGDWIYILVWSTGVSAFFILALFGGVRRTTMPDHGRAIARIETVSRTGRELDGVQELSVRLTVAPEGEDAYQTTTIVEVPSDDMRLFTSGAIIEVRRLSPHRPDVTIIPSDPASMSQRARRAHNDPSFIPAASSVPTWERATESTPATPRPGTRRRLGAGAQAAVSLVIITVAAVVTTVPAWGSISRAAQSLAAGEWDGTSLVTGRFQQDAVDAVADVVGGYEFTSVVFYDTYLIVDAPTTPGASTTDTYLYRYGRAWRDGPELIQPTDLSAELFDASDLDFAQVGAAVDLALSDAAIDDAEAHAYVSRDPAGRSAEPVISISLSGDYADASYVYDFDLTLLRSS